MISTVVAVLSINLFCRYVGWTTWKLLNKFHDISETGLVIRIGLQLVGLGEGGYLYSQPRLKFALPSFFSYPVGLYLYFSSMYSYILHNKLIRSEHAPISRMLWRHGLELIDNNVNSVSRDQNTVSVFGVQRRAKLRRRRHFSPHSQNCKQCSSRRRLLLDTSYVP